MIPQGAPRAVDPDTHTVPPDRGAPADQPKWRRDFPIEVAEDDYVTRRELVKFMVLTSFAFVAGHAWLAAKRSGAPAAAAGRTAIAAVDDLPVGGARTFEYPEGSSARLLVRIGPEEFVAYDQQCTHLLCPVVPAVAAGKLHCPCHNGWFDLRSGDPVAGPPRRRLPRVTLEVADGVVYATGVEVTPA